MTDPNATSTAAEATTAVSPDPRAIMAAMGVSCATCRHWGGVNPTDIDVECRHFGECVRTPRDWDLTMKRGDKLVMDPAHDSTTAAVDDNMDEGYLMTRASHFCAMWERHP